MLLKRRWLSHRSDSASWTHNLGSSTCRCLLPKVGAAQRGRDVEDDSPLKAIALSKDRVRVHLLRMKESP